MTLSEIDSKISSIVNVDSTVYTSAQRLIDINIWQHKVESWISESQDESDFDDANYTDYPDLTTPLVSGQRDYSIPTSEKVISIKRVDISYDGVNYYRAVPIDTGEMLNGIGPADATTQQTKTDALFSKTAPRYDVAYNSVFIYPRPDDTDVENGGKIFIEWTREIKEFTSAEQTAGTAVPGFDTAFHLALAYGPAYDFFTGTGQLKDAEFCLNELNLIQNSLKLRYGRKQKDRSMTMNPLPVNYK